MLPPGGGVVVSFTICQSQNVTLKGDGFAGWGFDVTINSSRALSQKFDL
jgi:hypothetical protein